MRSLTLALCLAANPVMADTMLSEVTGNWAGPALNGFYFRAVLSQVDDRARLQIWNGTDAVPTGEGRGLDNAAFALGAFATEQRLEVLESADGSILQVITAFADEEAEGREVVQISFIDNQFTVLGYTHQSTGYNPGGTPLTMSCEVDLWNSKVTIDGVTSDLAPIGFEAMNVSEWTFGAAFARGYCPRLE